MKSIIQIFSWVASALLEGISPGSFVLDNIIDDLRHYNESATKIAETMQRAWMESIRTLKVALGGNTLLSPKSRKQIAEKFVKEIITPFALQSKLTGKRLDVFRQNALDQCQLLENTGGEVIDFTKFNETILVQGLALSTTTPSSGSEIGGIIIERIQNHLPTAKELLELLWYRNLLLEGLVAHFSVEIGRNNNLADLVDRMDRQRIQTDLSEIREQINRALNSGNLHEMAPLGARASHLSAADEVYRLNESYQNLLGPIMQKLDQLSEDHKEMNSKLDEILQVLGQLQHLQKARAQTSRIVPELTQSLPEPKELQLAEQLNSMVRTVGWSALPSHERVLTANTLAVSLYDARKVVQSLHVLEEVIRQGTDDPSIYLNYFEILQSTNRNEEAVEVYRKLIELAPNMAFFPPGEYTMEEVIGKGGMAVVYKALQKKNNYPVAVKVLVTNEDTHRGSRNRFLEAARAVGRLNHANIVKIHTVSPNAVKYPYIVMEYLEGKDLYKKVKEDGPFSVQEGLDVARQIAGALVYAHQMGIVHRDLKPNNIVYHDNIPKLIDFGIAKWERNTTLTVTNESYYTLYYSAPEQMNNFHSADERSDIYSFGKTLYYMFTGEDPYDIDWDDVPHMVRPIIRKCTRKAPTNRYSSMREALGALEKVISGAILDTNVDEFSDSDFFPAVTFAEPVQEERKEVVPSSLTQILPPDCIVENGQIISIKDGAPMAYVPAGSFMMGDDSPDAELEEGPIHEVYLDAYLIDVYPVTNARYAVFLKAVEEYQGRQSPWSHPSEPKGKIYIPQFWYNKDWNGDDLPVVGVDWWDAYAYSKWAGKVLPTEAEWEKAARGTDQRYYPWGNDPPTPDRCNFNRIVSQTTPVGKYLLDKSPYGCHDMAGNVWEWCFDWYDPNYYRKSPVSNPTGPATGRCRAGRGGSWQKPGKRIRATTRGFGSGPEDSQNQLGFRTVKRLTVRKLENGNGHSR